MQGFYLKQGSMKVLFHLNVKSIINIPQPPPTSTLPSPRASGFMRLNTWPQLVKVFERIADTLRGERSLEGGPYEW